MNLAEFHKEGRVLLTNARMATVVEVFSTTGKKRKPRLVVRLDAKPSLLYKVAASSVVGGT